LLVLFFCPPGVTEGVFLEVSCFFSFLHAPCKVALASPDFFYFFLTAAFNPALRRSLSCFLFFWSAAFFHHPLLFPLRKGYGASCPRRHSSLCCLLHWNSFPLLLPFLVPSFFFLQRDFILFTSLPLLTFLELGGFFCVDCLSLSSLRRCPFTVDSPFFSHLIIRLLLPVFTPQDFLFKSHFFCHSVLFFCVTPRVPSFVSSPPQHHLSRFPSCSGPFPRPVGENASCVTHFLPLPSEPYPF